MSCAGWTMSFRGLRRTVGLEAGAPPNAEGRSRGSACAARVGTGFRWVPGRWRLDGTDMSPRMATRHVWRRAPRPAAGTFCRRRGCSHPRKGGFGNSGVGLFSLPGIALFSLSNSSILLDCGRPTLRLPSLVERPLSAPFCRPGPLPDRSHMEEACIRSFGGESSGDGLPRVAHPVPRDRRGRGWRAGQSHSFT